MTNWISRLRGQFRSVPEAWSEAPAAADAGWRKIAGLAVAGACGLNQIIVRPERNFQRIKLRSLGTDIEIYRWILEFHDGTVLDLSINCLLEGTESLPLAIAGRVLKKVVIKFDGSSVRRRGRLEIWAES